MKKLNERDAWIIFGINSASFYPYNHDTIVEIYEKKKELCLSDEERKLLDEAYSLLLSKVPQPGEHRVMERYENSTLDLVYKSFYKDAKLSYLKSVNKYISLLQEMQKNNGLPVKVIRCEGETTDVMFPLDKMFYTVVNNCMNESGPFAYRYHVDFNPHVIQRSKYFEKDRINDWYYYMLIAFAIKAYMNNQNNFENYATICQDLSKVTFKRKFNIKYNEKEKLASRIESYIENPTINKVLSKPYYKDFVVLRKALIEAINILNLNQLEKALRILEETYEQEITGYTPYAKSVTEARLKNLINEEEPRLLFSPMLMDEIGRFFYVNNRLQELEDNEKIKEEIFSYIKPLKSELFAEFQEGKAVDYFLPCLECVFNSDTYEELFTKLRNLRLAQSLYDLGLKKRALEIIKILIYPEKNFSQSENTLVMIDKPTRIVDRIKINLESTITPEAVDYIHRSATSHKDFLRELKNSEKNLSKK